MCMGTGGARNRSAGEVEDEPRQVTTKEHDFGLGAPVSKAEKYQNTLQLEQEVRNQDRFVSTLKVQEDRSYHLMVGMPKNLGPSKKFSVINPINTVLQLELNSAGELLETVSKTSQNCPQRRLRKLKCQ